MAGSNAVALICDTGALLDYPVKSAPDHECFRLAIDRASTRYVPGLVLAEVDYFLRDERKAMKALIDDLLRGAFTYAAPTIRRLATRDVGDFAAVRLRDGTAFELVVYPANPDR